MVVVKYVALKDAWAIIIGTTTILNGESGLVADVTTPFANVVVISAKIWISVLFSEFYSANSTGYHNDKKLSMI